MFSKLVKLKEVKKAKIRYLKLDKKRKKRLEQKRQLQKIKRMLSSDKKIILYNEGGFRVRVSLLKAFLVGTRFSFLLKTKKRNSRYLADHFSFDKRMVYLRLKRDREYFDDIFRIYYILWNTSPYYLQNSKLLYFLNKIERILIRKQLKPERRKRKKGKKRELKHSEDF